MDQFVEHSSALSGHSMMLGYCGAPAGRDCGTGSAAGGDFLGGKSFSKRYFCLFRKIVFLIDLFNFIQFKLIIS